MSLRNCQRLAISGVGSCESAKLTSSRPLLVYLTERPVVLKSGIVVNERSRLALDGSLRTTLRTLFFELSCSSPAMISSSRI